MILLGCQAEIKPTYKEEGIPFHIRKICKEEYGLDVVVTRAGDTLWIYAPLTKLFHEKFGIEKDKIFAEEVKEKLINILTTIGRVVLSADRAPEFFYLVFSDIELGIDYGLIGYVLDTKKFYAGFIPYTEADRRYVVKFSADPQAIGDKTGGHLKKYDIKFSDFLADQIVQRIGVRFQSENWKDSFKVDAVEGGYTDGAFNFSYKIESTSLLKKPVNIEEEVIKIIAYCLRTYEFDDFSGVSLTNLSTGSQAMIGRTALGQVKLF